ncbi:MAG: flagellar basal body rod protein FlgC [Anaerolineales bacterium]|nr:flagellar basal body rod protein FlgC [Anaerolineales bacterium]
MSFWSSFRIGASALTAQRLRLDVIANNIANAETTRTEDGGPYQRKDVVFQAKDAENPFPSFLVSNSGMLPYMQSGEGGVEVASIIEDDTPGERVYDPTHPDADEEGYVTYPNVNIVIEMTNMLSATRSYEANLAALDSAKTMALKALEIGR